MQSIRRAIRRLVRGLVWLVAIAVATLGLGVGVIGSGVPAPATGDIAAVSPSPASSPSPSPLPSPTPLGSGAVVHRPTEVFGFLPYWSMADWTDGYLRYDLLTTIAFFGIGVNANGSLALSGPGFTAIESDRAATIIDHAHAAGVRVVVTFETFTKSRNHRLVTNAKARTRFATEAAAFIKAHGLDGANVDIENLDGTDRSGYGLLVGELASTVHAADPAAEISVAVNANVSGARMARVAVASGADRAFLMGYAYRVASTVAAGSIDPYTGLGTQLDLVKSLDLYAANDVPPERIILGLPYYGMTWPTVSSDPHAARQPDNAGLGRGTAYRPRTIVASGPPAGSTLDYDYVEQSARLTWFDATTKSWYQTYFDDPVSLAPKEHLAVERGLAGIGMWALGDDMGQPGYWETIAATMGMGPPWVPPSPSPSASPSPSVSPSASPSGGASPSAAASPSASVLPSGSPAGSAGPSAPPSGSPPPSPFPPIHPGPQ